MILGPLEVQTMAENKPNQTASPGRHRRAGRNLASKSRHLVQNIRPPLERAPRAGSVGPPDAASGRCWIRRTS
jgi:hypothetical protein